MSSYHIPQFQVTSWVIQKDQSQAGLTNQMTSARLTAEVDEYRRKHYVKRLFIPPSSYNADQPQPWMRYTRMGHIRKSILDNDPSHLRMLTGNNQLAYQGTNLYNTNVSPHLDPDEQQPVQHGSLVDSYSRMAGLGDALVKKAQEITGSTIDDMKKRQMDQDNGRFEGRPQVLNPYNPNEKQSKDNQVVVDQQKDSQMEQIQT